MQHLLRIRIRIMFSGSGYFKIHNPDPQPIFHNPQPFLIEGKRQKYDGISKEIIFSNLGQTFGNHEYESNL